MPLEGLAQSTLKVIDYGIAILWIMFVVEFLRLVTRLAGHGKLSEFSSTAGNKIQGLLGGLFKKGKGKEQFFDKTKKEISIVPKGKTAEKINELTNKKGKFNKEELKDLLNQTYRASRRVYRYNKKIDKRLEDAQEIIRPPLSANKSKFEAKLKKIIDITKKEADFDALINDLVSKLTKILSTAPQLKSRLNKLIALNNSILLNLSRVKKNVNSALTETNLKNIPPKVSVAKLASEKIEKDILGLEIVVKEFEKELEI